MEENQPKNKGDKKTKIAGIIVVVLLVIVIALVIVLVCLNAYGGNSGGGTCNDDGGCTGIHYRYLLSLLSGIL